MAKGRKTGGRVVGTLNKVTREIKEIAASMAPAATKRLGELLKSTNEAVALGAIKEIYDRAYGKPTQKIAGDSDEAPITFTEIVRRIVG